jgi:hypothetical protein
VFSINPLNSISKMLLGDFIDKVGKKDVSKPTIGNLTLHEYSNDNEVRIGG